AIYYLLALEGRPTVLNDIVAALPPPQLRGRSMGELSNAAGACGLTLLGVDLSTRECNVPDRPFLAFVKRNGHGHFIVVRPIGHTGKLVQVFDGFHTPEIVDWINLFKSREWTGLAMIPRRVDWRSYASLGLGILFVTVVPLFEVYRRGMLAGRNRGTCLPS